ncbi:MAG TPA: choice-of-anchor Q domain-containing protein [Rhodanobacteraceae bacterium]|nr:choice-of-anchor Q domain-containing protein [Rhodanobacteraceae bacterium]
MSGFIKGQGARWPRARTVAVALATALAALSAPKFARAHIEAVTNCNDAGAGSLRDAVGAAAAGDTIDMSKLACATITLSSGAIVVAQESLTVKGAGADALAIDGGSIDRVFMHNGTGTLAVEYMTLRHGYYLSDTNPSGACVFSSGSVLLVGAAVEDCFLDGFGGAVVARGGGVYADGDLILVSSRLTGSTVASSSSPIGNSRAGAAVARGTLVMKYSTVSDNRAVTISGHNSGPGALQAYGDVSINTSTISGNYGKFFGAMALEGIGTATITNSTISGNATAFHSTVYTQVPLKVSNSTIAFNHVGMGAALYADVGPLELESTIISGNVKGSGTPADLDGEAGVVATGANNLIVASTIPVPPDTITDCARLLPLDANGGPTATHALGTGSPALEQGNNLLNLDYDQRGAARVSGALPDIGAYEWDAPQGFGFKSGFESVCDG